MSQTETITINSRTYTVENEIESTHAAYAAMLRGPRGGLVHYEVEHSGRWFALGGVGSRSPKIIAEG